MGYGLPQDHGLCPLYQLGNGEILWVIKGYGLSEVWVKRVSTVVYMFESQPRYSPHSSSLSSAGVLSDSAYARHSAKTFRTAPRR